MAAVTEVKLVGILPAGVHAQVPLPSHSFPRTLNPGTGSHRFSALHHSLPPQTSITAHQEWKFHFKPGKEGSRTACLYQASAQDSADCGSWDGLSPKEFSYYS